MRRKGCRWAGAAVRLDPPYRFVPEALPRCRHHRTREGMRAPQKNLFSEVVKMT
jgi:hypothetical protein